MADPLVHLFDGHVYIFRAYYSIASMEARVRTERDTKPRQAGKPATVVEGPVNEPSMNGHRNGQLEGEAEEEK